MAKRAFDYGEMAKTVDAIVGYEHNESSARRQRYGTYALGTLGRVAILHHL